jgi:predicted metal-dependent hydrolase
MPSKQFVLDGELQITVYKRKSSRHLRLSINAAGEVRVSIPAWAPYSAGVSFAQSRQSWLLSQRQLPRSLVDGQAIGKAHHLRFTPKAGASKATSRLLPGEVVVSHPPTMPADSSTVQEAARAGSIKALRAQAEQLLPQRLSSLAAVHDFSYGSVSVKRLTSRWGSCDQHSNIVLNLFLMQLPWECIDYVLLHELTHTQILRHGPDFWQAMEAVLPDVKRLRKRLRDYQPIVESVA